MAPARPAGRATPYAGEEAQRPLWLLRHHGERPRDYQGALHGQADLAEGALASVATASVVGEDAEDPGAVPASSFAHCSPVRNLANLFSEEPDAGILHVRICGGLARN